MSSSAEYFRVFGAIEGTLILFFGVNLILTIIAYFVRNYYERKNDKNIGNSTTSANSYFICEALRRTFKYLTWLDLYLIIMVFADNMYIFARISHQTIFFLN